MRITNGLKNSTEKIIELVKTGKHDLALADLSEMRKELEKVEVFSRWRFERNEVIKERATGYLVKVKGIGHSGDGWGYKVEYMNPEHEPTGEHQKSEWRYESEFEKAYKKADADGNITDIFRNVLNRLKLETAESQN